MYKWMYKCLKAFEPNTLIASLCLWQQAKRMPASLGNKYKNPLCFCVCARHPGRPLVRDALREIESPKPAKEVMRRQKQSDVSHLPSIVVPQRGPGRFPEGPACCGTGSENQGEVQGEARGYIGAQSFSSYRSQVPLCFSLVA